MSIQASCLIQLEPVLCIFMFDQLNYWLIAAGLLTLLTCALHTFVATARVATPLLSHNSNLSSKSRYTNYYTWHSITLTLLVQAGCFIWGALPNSHPDSAIIATVLATGFLAWNVGLNIWQKPKRSAAPQWMFWLPITAFGIAGLLYG